MILKRAKIHVGWAYSPTIVRGLALNQMVGEYAHPTCFAI
ncbi:MAG: hypothetical protein JWN51_2695 [Phycisphaerales bacterium]|nr:hypothetical protein [Phycisphaerales bacterium]